MISYEISIIGLNLIAWLVSNLLHYDQFTRILPYLKEKNIHHKISTTKTISLKFYFLM